MEWKRAIQSGLLVSVLCLTGCSKAGDNWLRLLGDPAEDVADAVATDSAGNIYIAGYTSGNRAGQQAQGGSDVVVAKYSASGDLEWERRWDGPKEERGRAIALTEDAIYVSGYSSAPLEKDPNKKDQQVLLLKLDTDGNVAWAREYGEVADVTSNALQESGEAIAVGGDGAVYVVGYTMNSFGKEISESFDTDAYLLKLDANGEVIDQMLFSTPRNESASGVAVRGGAIYLSGETSGTLGGDEGQKNPQEGLGDAFVMRVAETGGWIRLLGTQGQEGATGMVVDAQGNVWISGNASQGLGDTPGYGAGDGFAAAFDATGNLRWSALIGGASIDQANGIALDEDGESVYLTGMTWSDMSDPKSVNNNGQGNVYVARLNAQNGTFIRHTQKITPNQTDWGKAIATSPFGIVVAGFAGGALEQQPHGGSNDILLWKLNLDALEPKDAP